jgi:hypothetical protein
VRFKLGVKRAWMDVPTRLSIGPDGPIDSSKVVRALFAFADSVVDGSGAHEAVEQFLRRDPPRLAGRAAHAPIVDSASDIVAGCVAAVRALDRSYLYVQGPPGAGKTYSGSHMIAAALAEGRRVGVMSNSHKAIKDGNDHALTARNILVVAPYNVQVNLLKRVLPEGARVGTVDKFQGQEGEIVIVSMTTSSEADLPRHIEFLYSKNRLNVAVSRAKCLAIVIANPALMAIKCRTPEQMALVNTLCWLAEEGGAVRVAPAAWSRS